ncbi:MAG: lipid-A-disaccharide synthase [Chloracidobacterium sp.]|nr:lipid-A-disaccharide synthase [Chloracidobacterium sp.]
MSKGLSFFISAGEVSGDAHAERLVRAVMERAGASNCHFSGAAGPKMRSAGVEAVVRSDEMAVMGVAEIAAALPMFIRAYRSLRDSAIQQKPDAAILVDFPDFNLRLARSLKKAGIPVIYYISPQLWAWRSYRSRTIGRYVDLLLTILPFEKDWYAQRGIHHVEYIGHPLTGEVRPKMDRAAFRASHGLNDERPLVALLPGSRHGEIERHLPIILDAVDIISAKRPEIQFAIAAAGSGQLGQIKAIISRCEHIDIPIVENETYDLISSADAAIVASGTATLETGILGTPMVIIYRGSSLNYRLLKPLINIDHYGLINLIAGQRIVRELIQNDLDPTSLSDELLSLLEPQRNAAIREELLRAAASLGTAGASDRAAEAILKFISRVP